MNEIARYMEQIDDHECKRGELSWNPKPIINSETVEFKGTCSCGKVYRQIYSENDQGLWDEETSSYVCL